MVLFLYFLKENYNILDNKTKTALLESISDNPGTYFYPLVCEISMVTMIILSIIKVFIFYKGNIKGSFHVTWSFIL